MKKIIFLVIGLVLVQCSHVRFFKPTGLTPADFWKEQEQRIDVTKGISAKLRLTYRGKRNTVSGQGRMLFQPGSKIRLELRDPFGRVHYLVAMNGRKFVAHYPRQSLAYLDRKFGKAYVKDFLGMSFSFVDLQSILLGRLPQRARAKKMEDWKWLSREGQYQGTLRFENDEIICFVDSKRANLRKIIFNSSGGKIEVSYSHFEPCCKGIGELPKVSVARVVGLELNRNKTGLEVEWQKIDLLKELRPSSVFNVRLGKGVQKIVLK